jgi:hypothetical protein
LGKYGIEIKTVYVTFEIGTLLIVLLLYFDIGGGSWV